MTIRKPIAIVDTGLDVLVKEGFKRLQGQKVAILANQASISANFEHLVDLAVAHGVQVVKLFAPEHGFSGAMQDMEHVGAVMHPKYHIPIISLYGDHRESLSLRAEELHGVDVLLCDLQDIGSRYYTFHCTIAWALAGVKRAGIKLMAIDRPNFINAADIEGNLVKKTQVSFVGAYPLPNRHGFTMGEVVQYVAKTWDLAIDLEVVWMPKYSRRQYFDELGLPFVSPSPNMPSVNAAVVYPGGCLIEGTNLSEGRGTCTPFELIGAPFINADLFKSRLDELGHEGVVVRAATFKPMFHKHVGQVCGGVFVHVTERDTFKPLRFYLDLIRVAMSFEGFDWRREPYEFETDRLAIDLLLGDERLRPLLEAGQMDELFSIIAQEERQFLKIREDFCHY
jgi:uncharacterized protein YbbC (DUF1343 family)